ncbi:MAG: cytochrome c1 [Alphaproteobacteria bacterium]|nr:cytochrome c1 [Alphaproteobacteria bacterium]MBF0128517.1 cytochrome c1 [Alphaproteobacteria bacterium]
MRRFVVSVLSAAAFAVSVSALPPAASASEGAHLEKQKWSWSGLFGSYDQAALKRGFQVYNEVCANCHSLKLVAYRNLAEIGFGEDEIKAIAGVKELEDGPNDQGEMFTRFAKASDHFVPPFKNDQAARVANGGALPPDLSLITKARLNGPDYVYNLLLGYKDTPPADVTLMPGMSYNAVFPGSQIGMPPQIFDGLVTYADGTKATPEQITKDVVTFLNWAAEPELNARHGMGAKTLIFLLVLTALFYALKRQIWSDVH